MTGIMVDPCDEGAMTKAMRDVPDKFRVAALADTARSRAGSDFSLTAGWQRRPWRCMRKCFQACARHRLPAGVLKECRCYPRTENESVRFSLEWRRVSPLMP